MSKLNILCNNIYTNIEFFFFIIVINALFFLFFKKISNVLKIYDKPDNIRKFQLNKTPLLGGVLFFINISLITIYSFSPFEGTSFNNLYNNYRELYSLFITSMFIFFIGVYDDKYSLKPNTKFIYLSIVVLSALLLDDNLSITSLNVEFINRSIPLYNFSIFFTLFCFLLFINALNMFDGINLQVGFYTLFLLVIFIIFDTSVFLCLSLIFPMLIFLILNSKGKTFLGDNGSLLLAYVIGYIFIKSYNQNIISDIDTIFVLMMIPGIDMLRLFITRILQGKNAFHPDLNHIHHIFTKSYGNNSLILIQFLIMVPALVYLFVYKNIFTIIIGILIYLIMIYFGNLKLKK